MAPTPHASGSLDDGSVQFVWDRDEHHLEIDVMQDGTMEWFYRNRTTEECLGEDFSGEWPSRLKHMLELIGGQ